ncbi:hypothetical protein GCM10009416_48470 [Craurococcus roseus]|uniref:Secreted protein n=1 Tax=Craurococcus roseus TaxID=77585 RepID=A0ABP3R9M3_9PROT
MAKRFVPVFVAATMATCVSVWLVADHSSKGWKEEKAAREREYLVQDSKRRNTWWTGRWPPPDTPVRIESPFGRFTVPLANIGGRDEFLLGPQRFGPSDPLPDGSYRWDSFSLAFWMPDGAGVLTDPGHLLEHRMVDPVDLGRRRAPLRPRETGRPDPSPDRYVVVVGQFCPNDGSLPLLPRRQQGATLVLTGYGYGALDMYGCHTDKPPPGWLSVPIETVGRSGMFCTPAWDVCFG